MPIIKSAIKRARQNEKRRARNVGIKKDIKTAYKAFVSKPSAATLSAAQSEIDTAVKKNLIKKNTAARRVANLVKLAKASGVKTEKKVAAKSKPATTKPAAKPKAAATKPAKKAVAKKPAATKKASK